jgi:4-amino-4-deoxy-L-arabinose transferase-like glycosyltransferase
MQHRILLAAAFLLLVVSNVIWISRDSRPPFWDMAAHLSGALHIYDAVAASGPGALLRLPTEHLTGFYPPLYHTVIAGAWSLFGTTVRVARLANLLAVGVLLLATFGIGCFVVNRWTAAIAAILVSFYPLMLWLSRETLIDYWVTTMVAVAFWTLLKTDGFSDPRWSIIFGIVSGLGMLTKWTFVFFLILPALWLARRQWKNASVAAGIAALLTAYWYIPSIPVLRQFLEINTAGGVLEGDPERFSLGAIVFYIRALEGYQLFLPLFVAFIAGMAVLKNRMNPRWVSILLWIAGGWLGLLLFRNKDPRYSAPLLPAVALITALAFEGRRVLTGALMVFLVFQQYLVSFGIRSLPETVVLMKGVSGELSWDWNLYSQTYFRLWGRPVKEDWKIEHVLSEVSGGAKDREIRLGLVPDIPRFDSFAFQFYIDLLKLPVRLSRTAVLDQPAIADSDFLLMAEKQVRHEASFGADPRVNSYILGHPEKFQMAEWFSLPSGDVIRLYRVQ